MKNTLVFLIIVIALIFTGCSIASIYPSNKKMITLEPGQAIDFSTVLLPSSMDFYEIWEITDETGQFSGHLGDGPGISFKATNDDIGLNKIKFKASLVIGSNPQPCINCGGGIVDWEV
jgi:hypothetical protein